MGNRKILGGFVILFAIFCFLPDSVRATTTPVTCSGSGTVLSDAIGNAQAGDTLTVTGTCTENVTVNVDNLIIQGESGAQIIAQDSTQPAIRVKAHGVTINGFSDIQGGQNGIEVDGSAIIINNQISENTNAGIIVKGSARANIGFRSASDTSYSPNTITDPQGIIVQGSSYAGIAGNTITGSNSGTGNGILVNRVSQADIAGNTIDSFANGISVAGNSGVNLSQGASGTIFAKFNVTDPGADNSAAGIACSTGAYAAGYPGSLSGAAATSFDNTSIDELESPHSILVGTWNKVSFVGSIKHDVLSVTFKANGNGSLTQDNGTHGITWTLKGNTLKVLKSNNRWATGILYWTDANNIQYIFTATNGSGTLTLQRQ